MNLPKKIIWVQSLNFFLLSFFLFRRVFGKCEIRFDEHRVSNLTSRWVTFFNKYGANKIFLPANLCLNVADSLGYALDYHRTNSLFDALELFCQNYLSDETKDFQNMVKSYLTSYLNLDSRVIFIVMVEQQMSNLKTMEHEIYLKSGLANQILIDFFKSKGLNVKQTFPLKDTMLKLGAMALLTIKVLFSQVTFKRDDIAENKKPSVWIEYPPAHGVWETFQRYLSGIVKTKNYRIVYYFDRRDTVFNDGVGDVLNKKGFGVVNLRRFMNIPVRLREVGEAFRYALQRMRFQKPLWLSILKYHYKILFFGYLNLFKNHKAKVLIQHQEISWIQELQAQAIKAAGGVMIGLHWSNWLNYKYLDYVTPQHVFFVWGRAHYEILRKKGNTCEHILPCGIWVGEDSANSKLEKSFDKNVNFVMAVFDTSAAYNIELSPLSLAQFYLGVIELLESNSSWGAIIKSKQWHLEDLSFLPSGEEIKNRLKSLIDKKRVMMLDFIKYTPVIAAKNADLSICCGINSAGMIAALHGCKVIHWECQGYKDYPGYDQLLQKVIFEDLEGLKVAVHKYYEGDTSIGDFSPYRQDMNYFSDTLGLARIIHFIDLFMDHVGAGMKRDEALSGAVKKYAAEYQISNEFLTA